MVSHTKIISLAVALLVGISGLYSAATAAISNRRTTEQADEVRAAPVSVSIQAAQPSLAVGASLRSISIGY